MIIPTRSSRCTHENLHTRRINGIYQIRSIPDRVTQLPKNGERSALQRGFSKTLLQDIPTTISHIYTIFEYTLIMS